MAENPQPSESMCSSLGRSGPLDRHRGVGPSRRTLRSDLQELPTPRLGVVSAALQLFTKNVQQEVYVERIGENF